MRKASTSVENVIFRVSHILTIYFKFICLCGSQICIMCLFRENGWMGDGVLGARGSWPLGFELNSHWRRKISGNSFAASFIKMTIVEMAKWVLFYISIHLKNDGCFRKGDQICSEDVANQIHDKMTLRTIRISTQHHLFVADHLIRVVQSEQVLIFSTTKSH